MNLDGGIQLNDLRGILRRRAKVAAITALGVLLAGYWLAMALPNVYTSYATVLVEPQAVAEDLVSAGVAESDLNSRLHLMTAQILSRPRLSRIIDDLDLYGEESLSMLRDEIIDLMREDIRVEPVVPELQQQAAGRSREIKINEFRISYDNYDALRARDVAQRLANDFIETHIDRRVQVSQKSLDFMEGELERLSERIRKVEAQIAQVKNENPGMLPEDMSASQRRLERILQDITFAQRSLAAARSDEEFYRSQLAAAKAFGVPNDDASPARRLELLKLQLAEYEARGFTAKHPDIIKTKGEIAGLETGLLGEEGGEGPLLNPVAQQAEAALLRAQLQRTSAEEEIARLTLLGQELQGQLEATPAVAEQLDVLKRDYEHLFTTFQDFSKRHNEASVQAQLERRQLGEQFRVLEAAFVAPAPSAPNRLLIVLLAAFFGVALGAGVGILLEATDTSPHDARQLQARVQLPVLAAVPQIWLESDRVRQRRGQIRAAFATVGVVLFALVGGAANYLWVNGLPGAQVAIEASPTAPAPTAAPSPGAKAPSGG